jgi:hypothetical protein
MNRTNRILAAVLAVQIVLVAVVFWAEAGIGCGWREPFGQPRSRADHAADHQR